MAAQWVCRLQVLMMPHPIANSPSGARPARARDGARGRQAAARGSGIAAVPAAVVVPERAPQTIWGPLFRRDRIADGESGSSPRTEIRRPRLAAPEPAGRHPARCSTASRAPPNRTRVGPCARRSSRLARRHPELRSCSGELKPPSPVLSLRSHRRPRRGRPSARAREPGVRLGAVASPRGATCLLKWLGESRCRRAEAVAEPVRISVPFNLMPCARRSPRFLPARSTPRTSWHDARQGAAQGERDRSCERWSTWHSPFAPTFAEYGPRGHRSAQRVRGRARLLARDVERAVPAPHTSADLARERPRRSVRAARGVADPARCRRGFARSSSAGRARGLPRRPRAWRVRSWRAPGPSSSWRRSSAAPARTTRRGSVC